MIRDLIVGVVKGYGWPELQPYAVSLANCGFEGEKMLFVEGITDEAREKLTELYFTLVDFESPENIRTLLCNPNASPEGWMRFNRFRYKPFVDYLEGHLADYRNVLWCDVRDLYFQLDPAEWMLENLKPPYRRIICAGEGCLIKDQPHNTAWVQAASPTDFSWLKHEEVICSGTIAGDAEAMLLALKTHWELTNHIEDLRAGEQGIFNYLMRQEPFARMHWIPRTSDAWAATGFPTKIYYPGAYSSDDAPVWAEDMVVYTPGNREPFVIVHQYDRDPNWKRRIEEIMAA